MVKVLPFRFQRCFGLISVLLVKGFSKTGLLRHLTNHFLGVRKFENTSVMWVILVLKMFTIETKFRKSGKKINKIFLAINWLC